MSSFPEMLRGCSGVDLKNCEANVVGGDMRRTENHIAVSVHVDSNSHPSAASVERGKARATKPVGLSKLWKSSSNRQSMANVVTSKALKYTTCTLKPIAPAFLERNANALFRIPYLYTRHIWEEHPYGYPLYRPEPDRALPLNLREKGIRIGDIGLITQDGSFDLLFNLCDATMNAQGAPDHFETLNAVELSVREIFPPDTHLPGGDVRAANQQNGRISYVCSAEAGAILELPQGATCYEALNQCAFQDLAARHAENWYKYTLLKRNRDASNGSLYMVTGCVKSNLWGIAVFNERSGYLEFMSKDPKGRTPQELYCWKGIAANAEVGPHTLDLAITDDKEENQCVFLRGYTIKLKSEVWMKIKRHPSLSSRIVGKIRHLISL